MGTENLTLDDLRRRIDEIDDGMHDLIMRRAEIVELVARTKGPQADSGMRPGREAEILRRLAARHGGPFPRGSVMRIWRELIASLTAMQGPYRIAVFEGAGLWDLARDHFGSHTDILAWGTRREVIAGVANGTVTHGVLPWPTDEDERPWWPGLWSAAAPRAVLRLPFAEPGNARGGDMPALVLSRVAPEETGHDRSLLLIETDAQLRRAATGDLVRDAGLAGEIIAVADEGMNHALVEVEGFLRDGDPPLAAVAGRQGVSRVKVVGAWPAPLSAA